MYYLLLPIKIHSCRPEKRCTKSELYYWMFGLVIQKLTLTASQDIDWRKKKRFSCNISEVLRLSRWIWYTQKKDIAKYCVRQ